MDQIAVAFRLRRRCRRAPTSRTGPRRAAAKASTRRSRRRRCSAVDRGPARRVGRLGASPAPSLQGAVDGRCTGVEQRRDLIGPPAEDVVQDHGHALGWRETPQSDDEGEADVVAPFGELGGAVPRRRGRVRRRASTPARDRRRRRGGAGGAARRSRRWWRCGTATCAGCSCLELVTSAPRAHHRLLDGVVGLGGRAEHPATVAGQRRPMLLQLDDIGDRSRSTAR